MANHQLNCIWQFTAAAITVASAILSQSVMASPSPPVCMPVSVLIEAMESTKARFVVFGEVHGASEIPDFFADAVCQLSESRPILVSLEYNSHDGHVIDRYVRGDPGVTASVGCHEHETVPPTRLHPRGIIVDARAHEGNDCLLSVGKDYTASAPVAGHDKGEKSNVQ